MVHRVFSILKKLWVLTNFGQYSKKVAKVCFLIEVVAAGWPTQFFDRPPFFQYIVVLNECSGKKWTKIASLLSAQWVENVEIVFYIFCILLCFHKKISLNSVLKIPYKTMIVYNTKIFIIWFFWTIKYWFWWAFMI